ncbi:MAG: hypothetical protein K6A40_00450 [Solobacterium sp.]|nr:hypothetical protein [Solobacterium sp.]
MDIEKTRTYYQNLKEEDVCQCRDCQYFVRHAKAAFPALAEYLASLGADIEKPFELMPLCPDENGQLLYIGEQYVLMGSSEDFVNTEIGGLEIRIADSHPITDISEEHFVIEVSSLSLKVIPDEY